ncbi:glycoside hydrolase domain-containing protein [Gemmatimonadota bacterium]
MKKKLLLILLLLVTVPLQAEITVWPRSWLVPASHDEIAPRQKADKLLLQAAPGEYEPAVFAVRSDEATTVTVVLSGIVEPGWLPPDWCDIRHVSAREDGKPAVWLYEIDDAVKLEAGRTEYFWITVRIPDDAAPGIYRGRVYLQAEHQMQQVNIECEVLPFRLAKSEITNGMFMADVNLPPGWYADMKIHGIEAVQYFWGYNARVINDGGRLKMDLSRMDRFMDDLNKAGLDGPVVVSLGNDYHLHYERRIAEAFGLPLFNRPEIGGKRELGPEITPQLDSLFVEGLRQITAHWRDKGWHQELVILIYDEPTERLLERCKHRYDLLKTAIPDTRVYGVVMNRREWAESMLDQMDIIVANGDFEAMRELASSHDKDYWVYSGIRGLAQVRFNKGCLPWKVGASGAFTWMYNYFSYDPEGCMVIPHPENPQRYLRSVNWETVREGADDLRYFATAERLIRNSSSPSARRAEIRLDELKEGIEMSRRSPGELTPDVLDRSELLAYYNTSQAVRAEVIEIILGLLKDDN